MTPLVKKKWVVEASNGRFWLEDGGTTSNLSEAEHYATKKAAEDDIKKWCSADEKAVAKKDMTL